MISKKDFANVLGSVGELNTEFGGKEQHEQSESEEEETWHSHLSISNLKCFLPTPPLCE